MPGFLEVFGVLFFFLIFITSISLFVIGLVKLFVSYWFIVGRLYFSRNLSISSRLSNLLSFNYSSLSFKFFSFFNFSAVLWCLHFHFLFTWVFSLFFLVKLAEGLLLLIIFQNPNSVSLKFFLWVFYSLVPFWSLWFLFFS
jgi:hypothetical protein